MTDTIHSLIEQYGLIAVFLGCVAEGETAAILAGFFAHQGVFVPWQAAVAFFLGAFGGDAAFFLAGRRFSDTSFVARLRRQAGFDRALDLIHRYPTLYVIGNRYLYGLRLVGGVAAGMSRIPVAKFILLNAVSAAIWTALFLGIGYVFGLGAERIVGAELMKHQRLLAAIIIAIAATAIAAYAVHRFSRRN